MASTYNSEFDFLKLLTGLNTAVAGALIYGYEHLLHVQRSRWLLAFSVFAFVVSLLIALRAFRAVINVDMVAQNMERNPDWKIVLPEVQKKYFEEFPKAYRRHMLPTILFFQLGIVLAFIFFVWNLWR